MDFAGALFDAGDGLAGAAGVVGWSSEADDEAEEVSSLDAELPLEPTGKPEAFLHPSDSSSLCSLRQATTRPPPGCTAAQNFLASAVQAARMAAISCACVDCGHMRHMLARARHSMAAFVNCFTAYCVKESLDSIMFSLRPIEPEVGSLEDSGNAEKMAQKSTNSLAP